VILYHGSNIQVAEIDLGKCRPYRDFGRGFYLTVYEDQAKRMAERVVRLYGGSPVISLFEYNEATSYNFRVLRFEKPTTEWAEFVMNNRSRTFDDISSDACNIDAKYDIVVGPVANDDMALLFRQYTDDLISLDILAQGMEFRELTNQYSFHTRRAISALSYQGTLDGQE
jgi:hypothetical protein